MKRIIIKCSYPKALKSYNFVWNIRNYSRYKEFHVLSLKKSYSRKKSFCICLSSLTICFGTVLINDSKTIFDVAIILKITIFPSNVTFSFSIFPKFVKYLLQCYKNFSFLSTFRCKRNKYLIF